MRRITWVLVPGFLALTVGAMGQEVNAPAPAAEQVVDPEGAPPQEAREAESPTAQSPEPEVPAAELGADASSAAAPSAEASEAPPAETPSVTPDAVVLDPTAPGKTEVTLDLLTRAWFAVGFSGPLGAQGTLRLLHGLGADVRDEETRVKAVCAIPMPHCAQGFLLQADAGSGGGKLSLGIGAWAKVRDEDFRGSAGVALRLGLARTWGNPIGTEPGLTYLGPELDLAVMRVNLTLGVLFRLSGDRGAGALFSWGLGFGL